MRGQRPEIKTVTSVFGLLLENEDALSFTPVVEREAFPLLSSVDQELQIMREDFSGDMQIRIALAPSNDSGAAGHVFGG